MHNQDTAKDDFMESILEIIAKIKDYYIQDKKKDNKKEIDEKEVNGNEVSEYQKEGIAAETKFDDERILRFQKAMKEVMRETDSVQVSNFAQTFHDNPVESMKMLQSIVSERTVEDARELVKQARDTSSLLENIRSSINMNDPKAFEHISVLNALNSNEQKKVELAENILNGIRPLEQVEDNEHENRNKKDLELEKKNEKTKDREMDGPER